MARARKRSYGIKHLVAAALTAVCLWQFPWQTAHLVAQTMVQRRGFTQMPNTNRNYWEVMGLEARIRSFGYNVEYNGPLNTYEGQAYGLTVPSEHTVYIEKTLSWDARYEVLAHEGGHVLAPLWVQKDDEDVFVELVAWRVTGEHLTQHATYLGRWKMKTLLVALAGWPEIEATARLLRDR